MQAEQMPEALIRFDHADFRWNSRPILNDFSFDVPEAPLTWIIGKSGVGKSTLLKLMTGHLRLQRGKCYVKNHLDDAPTTKIGYVPQDCGLFHWLRTKDNIQFARHLNKFGAKPDFDWFDQLTERFDLTEAKDLWPAELSGGMTQRVAILRALQASPKILVLDEPFSAIDTENTRRVLEVLREYTDRGYGQTIISTHEVALISEKVDSIVSISQPTGVLGIDAVMQSA